jgi:lysine/ornithine N-monooxygenase
MAQSSFSKPFPQPVTGYTQPFWRTEPHKLDTFQSTPQLPESTDILIIGGGYVGASIAYHLLKGDANTEPPSTVLLEAREACSGATGRNGLNTNR